MGEAQSLSAAERRLVIETLVEAADGRVTVTAGVSSETPARSTRLRGRRGRRRRRRADAAAAARLPRRRARDRGLLPRGGGGRAACRSWPTTTPRRAAPTCRPALVARLAEIDGVVAVKECSGDARRIAEILNATDDFEVLVGGDDWALEGFCAGATRLDLRRRERGAARVRRPVPALRRGQPRGGARDPRAPAAARPARHEARSSSSTSRRRWTSSDARAGRAGRRGSS